MTNATHSTADRVLTDRQRVKIFAAATELRLSYEGLHQLLEQVLGKTSVRALTKKEGRIFIDHLISLGASGHGRNFVPSHQPAQEREARTSGLRPVGDNVVRIVTHEQLLKIGYLMRDLGLTRDSSRFLTIVARAMGKTRMRTTLDGSRVIDALTAIARRERDGEPGPGAAA